MYEIYTKPDCSYCYKAKNLLTMRGLAFQEFQIGREVSLAEVKEKFPNAKMVPIILKDGLMIGTFEKLEDHLKEIEGTTTNDTEAQRDHQPPQEGDVRDQVQNGGNQEAPSSAGNP